jgi:hypothetical protein
VSESVFEFQARAERSFRQRIEAKNTELNRAKRALRLEAAKLKEQREWGLDVLRELETIRETFRGKGASKAAYIAIFALHRAQRVLGFTPGEPVYSAPDFCDAADRRFAK